MSSVFYRYENSLSKVVKGSKNVVKETIIDGSEEGVSFSYLEKNGDNFYRIKGKQLKSGKFEVLEKKGEDESTNEMSEAELMKLLGANKKLNFVVEYMKKERVKLMKENKEGGAKKRRGSKKSSKKTSKKASKKGTKKTSKKVKRSSKKTSKKASKKSATKKVSKKGSKKVKRSSKKTSKKTVTKKGSKKTVTKKGSKKVKK